MLTNQHKQAIKGSWRLVTPILDTAVELFYRRLFELRPDVRSLFPSDMASQHKKLAATLGFVVKSLDWPLEEWAADQDPESDLFLVLLALGRRHRFLYSVQDDHYEPVGVALMWALDQGLGQAFNPITREAWAKAYQLLSTTMKLASNMAEVGIPSRPPS
jgi:hemoglobin-like flavoprotein